MAVLVGQNVENALFYLTLAAYVLALAFNWLCVLLRHKVLEKYRTGIVVVAFAANIVAFALSLVRTSPLGVQVDPFRLVNPYQFVLIFTVCIVLINFTLLHREHSHMSGTLALPIVTVLLLYILVILQQPMTDFSTYMIYRSWWLVAYMAATALADGAFAVGFGLGIAYLLKDYLSKTNKRGLLGQYFPSLELLDEFGYRMVAFGFPFYSLSIILGAIWANGAWGRFWSWQPKETWSLISWLAYLAFFHVRFLRDWRGSRSAWMLVMAYFAVLFTFIGINYFLPGQVQTF